MLNCGLIRGSLFVEAGAGDVVDGAAVLMNPTGRRIAGWCGGAVVGHPWRGVPATNPRMKRRLGNSGRAARLELAAQHRQHLGTKQIQLVQDCLEGQTRVIHEEKLALIVAHHLAEAKRSVNDLLW